MDGVVTQHRDGAVDSASQEKDPEATSSAVPHSSQGEGRLLLTEEQALERARKNPNESEPIYLTFSWHDKDNPRNWPKWKKWYITCFASALNILT